MRHAYANIRKLGFMIRHLLLPTLLLAFAQVAMAQDCVRVACAQGDHCEVTPSGLTAVLPPGWEIRSIRGNTKIATRGDAALLDCRPADRLAAVVSADQASIYGAVYLTGRLQARGTLRFEPNDGGELEFRPSKDTLQSNGQFFKTHFARIKLDAVQPAVKIAPPPSLAKVDCWQAKATAELSDFSVLVGDTSAAGTYARKARVTQVSGFARCTWGGG